jgi:putative peptide zinc metalloprotease protein
VAHDPASNRFFRMSPVAHELIGLLDGARTVEQAWSICLDRHGDDAPTQPEAIDLVAQLYNANLLSIEASPETEQLLRRSRQRTAKKVQGQLAGIMYLRVRLFNPDAIISAVEPVLRPLLNRWGLLAWAVFVGYALFRLVPERAALVSAFDDAIAPANWPWLLAVFVVAKTLHELGHGVICKRFGGQVPEFGALLLVLVPSPYVDASATWAFPSRWQRMAVGAGGMIFELTLAAAAAHLWLASSPGELPGQIAYNAMLTAGISTVFFNANPLMKFDGYYILSDLLEIPNLMQRSFKMLQYQAQRVIYRLDDAVAPTSQPGEGVILTVFGVGALIYRVVLFIGITLLVMGKLFAIGLVLAVWTGAAWFLGPLTGFVRWLSESPKLADQRGRAVAVSLGLFALGAAAVGMVPAPDGRRGVGVVESEQRTGLFSGESGFVETVLVRPGEAVGAGEPVLVLANDELRQRLRLAMAQLAEFESVEREMTAESPSSVEIARERVAAQRDALAYIQSRIERLTVRAPHAGVLVGPDLADRIGAVISEGAALGEIVDVSRVRVAATVAQTEAAWLFDPDERFGVRIRPVSLPGVEVGGGAALAVGAGQRVLPHAGLGAAGGGTIAVMPDDETGRVSSTPQFVVYIQPEPSPRWTPTPGERVHLRYRLKPKPLLAQWVDRLHKLVQGRVQL